jgi:cytochrome c peroxidase
LSNYHKELILKAIEGTVDKVSPQSEDQLDRLQVAILPYYFPIVCTLIAHCLNILLLSFCQGNEWKVFIMKGQIIILRKSKTLTMSGLLLLTLSACNSDSSIENTVEIIANNSPVANAGVDQSVTNQTTVTLNGSGSSDLDGDTLTYNWQLAARPTGSSASLLNAQSSTPQFVGDAEGAYTLSLTVNDGTLNSIADQVTITTIPVINLAPIANSHNVTTTINSAVVIGLIATDTENDVLTYMIENDSSNGSLTLDENRITYHPNNGYTGADSFTFFVNDGSTDSNVATVNIEILTVGETTTLVDGSVVTTRELVSLGDLLYNDTNLSNPIGQSCASCHAVNAGFDDPNSANPTSVGADGFSFGTRNSPTVSYSAHIPAPTQQGNGPQRALIGGLFLDGRAQSLEEQAKGPFLNTIEMGNATESEVIAKIANSTYATEFELLFGESILDDTERSYNYVADAIAAFERTSIFSPFTSTFDQVQAGNANFTAAETRGQTIFNNKGDCRRCHHSDDGAEIFSDFSFKNIGVPSNQQLPAFFADPNFVDLGLGAQSDNAMNNGEFRTSTLRNIANTAPYMHNGVFDTLREVINFYNTRDTTFSQEPEVNQNVDQGGRIGELGLTDNEIDDLVVFLGTLSDQ